MHSIFEVHAQAVSCKVSAHWPKELPQSIKTMRLSGRITLHSVAQISLVRGSSLGFRSLPPHFVVFIHGERDLSNLPSLGGATVQISLRIGECECCRCDLAILVWEPLTKEGRRLIPRIFTALCSINYYLPEEHLRDISPVADRRMAGSAPLLPGQGQARPRLVLPPRRLLRLRVVQVLNN